MNFRLAASSRGGNIALSLVRCHLVPVVVLFIAVSHYGVPKAAALSILSFTSASARGGERGQISLQTTTNFPIQGLSASVAYDASAITILDVHHKETILDDLDASFFIATLYPDEGSMVIGVLVETKPPWENRQIPGISLPLDIAYVEFEVHEDAESQTSLFQFVDGLGLPPTHNLFSVDNQTQRPEEQVAGEIVIIGSGARFIRGDVNQDTKVDVTDAQSILESLFLGTYQMPCLDAADATDNEKVDLADSLFLLHYYFLGGAAPLPPFPEPGIDATRPEVLDCGNPVFSPSQ